MLDRPQFRIHSQFARYPLLRGLLVLTGAGLAVLFTLLAVSPTSTLDLLPESVLGCAQRKTALKPCYPYHNHGIITIDYANPFLSEFTSLTGRCPAKNNLVQGLVSGNTASYLHNRHILLLGDSVDRGLADFFASLPGATSLTDMNPLEMDDGRAKQALSREYTFAAINLTISNFFFYGLDERGLWNDSFFQAPWLWQDRFDIVADSWKGRGGAPDLIIAQSGFWDLSAYQFPAERPADHSDAYDIRLAPGFREDWMGRASRFIERIRATFPQSQLYWRPVHFAGRANHFHGAKVNGLHPVRVMEMRSMQLAVAEEMDVPVMPLHKLVDWQEAVIADDVHFTPVGYALYAEMALAALDSRE